MDFVTMLPIYIVVFLLGVTVGSFLNVCILRIPAHESIVTGPSHCMSCGQRLKWYDMVPLFSYLALGGKCRFCKAPVSPQYPLIEGINGVLWLAVIAVMGPNADAFLGCAMTSALLVLSVIDARTQEIPLGTTIFIAALGGVRLLLHLPDWRSALIGAVAVSGVLLLVLVLSGGRAIGGGDVKLMAACGLFLGWKLIVFSFFLACFLGAVIHLIRMKWFGAGRQLAMGPYLSAGVFLAMLFGQTLIDWYIGLL
jgi:leader peptidase (prepilin peptidase)/N-methyltransferase